jgi:serine protease Do
VAGPRKTDCGGKKQDRKVVKRIVSFAPIHGQKETFTVHGMAAALSGGSPVTALLGRAPLARWLGTWLLAGLLGQVALLSAPEASARTAPETFADLAEKLLPAVVNISTTQTVEGQSGVEIPMVPPGSPFEEFFKEFLERSQPRERQRRATSLGSGFIINEQGHVITNNHVIQDADEITVILQDETRLEAKVVGRDSKTDIAVLKVEPPRKLAWVPFGDSDDIRVGDWVVAIGNPFGFGGTVTAGILSARGRDINAGPYDDFLQTDAPINRGNSGGPMFNLRGEVIGINTAIFSPSGGSVGIGFAIPSNDARPVIKQLIEFGQVRRGWLGVRIQTVTDEIAESLGLKSANGALVASVIEGGPAQKADIRAGDVILEFDGKSVNQMRRLPRIVADTEVGRTVDVKIWRDNKELKTKVKVGVLEEEEEKVAASQRGKETPSAGESKVDVLGVTLAPIDQNLRDRFNLSDETRGVVITAVDPQGPAAEKGLRPGEVIVEVSQEEVNTPADVTGRIDAARKTGRKSVLMLVEGQGGLRFIAVRIDKG